MILEGRGGRGHERGFIPLLPERLWSFDPDGGGKEALLILGGGQLQANRGGADRTLWEWPLPGGKGDVVSIEVPGLGILTNPVIAVGRDGTN